MVKRYDWCTMTSILFYVMIGNYYFNYFTRDNFNSIGNEFVGVVFVGLLAILNKK